MSETDDFCELVKDLAHGDYDGQNGTSAAVERGLAILAAVRAEEREACAKLLVSKAEGHTYAGVLLWCAAAIRVRTK